MRPKPRSEPAGSGIVVDGIFHGDDGPRPIRRELAEEVPVAIAYNGLSHAVVMASPADLEDLARGFTLSERIADDPAEILDVETKEAPDGIVAAVTLTARRFAELKRRRRSLVGRTGCGLCGVESLDDAVLPVRRVPAGPTVAPAAIRAALAALPHRQPMNAATGATHAAAFADAAGTIRSVREDVGRHNALDKLIGAMAAGREAPSAGFVLLTSRCSYEMVQKAAGVGISVLVAISAPTALALRLAAASGLTLVALARADGMTVFCDTGRIGADEALEMPHGR